MRQGACQASHNRRDGAAGNIWQPAIWRIIFFQPFQFFAQLDVAVPGILVQAVAFAGKDEEAMRNAQRLQGAFHGDSLQIAYAYIGAALHQVGGRFDFVELKERGFALVEGGVFPGLAAEIPGVVPGFVVVAPVGGVLHGSGAGDRGFEAGGLGDEPVGHVAAVAVAADGQVVGVGVAVFDEGIDAGEDVAAGLGDQVRLDFEHEVVAVSGGAAIVGAEDEPAVGRRRGWPSRTSRRRSGCRRHRQDRRESG